MSIQNLFIDNSLEEKFREDGFIVIHNFIDKQQLDEAFSLFNDMHTTIPNVGMWHSAFNEDQNLKKTISSKMVLSIHCLHGDNF